MSLSAYLPAVPQPPHDPKTWVLNKQAGWHVAKIDQLEINQQGALSLIKQQYENFANDLVLPANIVADDQDIWLLDHNSAHLKHFNNCECRFEVVPFIGGKGCQPRMLFEPGGMALQGGVLYLCDAGNHRIQVFDLYGWTLRQIWLSPSAIVQSGFEKEWIPIDIAIDQHNKIWVLDRANQAVLLFDCHGTYLSIIKSPGSVNRLIIDIKGNPYLWLENDEQYQLCLTEDMSIVLNLLDKTQTVFSQLPFPLRVGNFNLSAYCQTEERAIWFDSHGDAVDTNQVPEVPAETYLLKGNLITSALDSQRNLCQWDRIELQCRLPKGARLYISTFTSELYQEDDEIIALDESEWHHCITFNSRTDIRGIHRDGLVRSEPGRFLWLKILFEGDTTVTPVIDQINLDYPRISLRRYLPGVFGAEALSTDFTDRFLAIFDRGFRQIEYQVDHQARLFDPDSAPHGEKQRDFLSWLASWVGVQFFHGWTVKQKREFLKQASQLFSLRGTRKGLMQQLLWYVGITDLKSNPDKADCAACSDSSPPPWRFPEMVLEHFYLRRWMFLGAGRLSEQATLWGEQLLAKTRLDNNAINGVTRLDNVKDAFRDPFHIHAHQFSVFVPASCASTVAKNNAIKDLVEREKPAYTQANIVFVKPRFRIGIQSMIGFDSVVGRWPAGVSLQNMKLGRATVLTSETNPQSTTRVGSEARIGQTTLMK